MDAVLDAMSSACDTAVRGMMFHSDHADLMRLLGLHGFSRLHEKGHRSDSKAYRRLRAMAIDHLCVIPSQGPQKASDALDGISGRTAGSIGVTETARLVEASLKAWADWEEGASAAYGMAADALSGHRVPYEELRRLQRDSEGELVEARLILTELMHVGGDMSHVHDMQERY